MTFTILRRPAGNEGNIGSQRRKSNESERNEVFSGEVSSGTNDIRGDYGQAGGTAISGEL